MKHGILSKEALVVVGDGYEDQEVFEDLSSALLRDIAPVGALEELLVDELIMLTWRRRRALKYETGITSYRSGSIAQSLEQLTDQAERMDQELSALDQEDPLEVRPQLWTRVFEAAEGRFEVPVDKLLGLESPWDSYHDFSREQIEQVIEAACQSMSISVKDFWRVVKEEVKLDHDQLAPNQERRRLDLEQKLRLAGLPRYSIIEKVQRYEAHISRQFYRALHELQRLQSSRRGSRPLAPLAIDIDFNAPSSEGAQ